MSDWLLIGWARSDSGVWHVFGIHLAPDARFRRFCEHRGETWEREFIVTPPKGAKLCGHCRKRMDAEPYYKVRATTFSPARDEGRRTA